MFARETLGGLALDVALGLGPWRLRTIDNYQMEALLTLAMVMTGRLVGHFSRSGGVL